jgi:transposase InsO family protein
MNFSDDKLIAAPTPANQFPDYVIAAVQSIKKAYPLLGTRAIAAWLAKGGLQISATSVRRSLAKPVHIPQPPSAPFVPSPKTESARAVASNTPNNVWNIDITTVPITGGLALAWLPWAFPSVWPFAWKVVAVFDHFSRKVIAIRTFPKEPSASDIVSLLEEAVRIEGCSPKHLITDKGIQFFNSKSHRPNADLQTWLSAHNVKPRFGAVGKHGSIAILERFWRTLKQEGLYRMFVPYDILQMNHELRIFADWYNCKRPHSTLNGLSPRDLHNQSPPVVQRLEPRARYPVSQSDLSSGKVKRISELQLTTIGFRGREHLPVIEIKEAA